MKSKSHAYLLHRTGTTLGLVGVLFWVAFFLENLDILSEPIGRAVFFWSPSLILMTSPLVLGLSKKDAFRSVFFELSLFGAYGALALVLPADILPRILSILTIALFLILIMLKRSHRNSLILEIKVNVNPSMLIESLALFAVSCLFAFSLQSLGLVFAFNNTFSSITRYLFLWTTVFIALSIIMIPIRIVRKSFQ